MMDGVELVRSREDRVLGGVCAGVAHALNVDPAVVRVATVLLTLANGVGLLFYLAAWVVMPEGQLGPAATEDAVEAEEPNIERAVALACITLGVLLLVRQLAPVFPDNLVWPGGLIATGIAVAWSRADRQRRRLHLDPLVALSRPGTWLRLLVGSALLILGLGWLLAANQTFEALGSIGLAVLATALGVGLILGPWIAKVRRQAVEERRQRIRSEERANLAAHLHDSVLQTLALIQRHADSPQQARSLARRQERELRAWLFDERAPRQTGATTLDAVVDQLSSDVEAHHDVTVDAVVVGDLPLDERVEALVGAVREAVVNAARHSGETEVSLYVEVTAHQVEAFVRDRGKGFDPDETAGWERRGITDSIVGRMARHGGTATVRSTPGEGTEVSLRLPLAEERSA